MVNSGGQGVVLSLAEQSCRDMGVSRETAYRKKFGMCSKSACAERSGAGERSRCLGAELDVGVVG